MVEVTHQCPTQGLSNAPCPICVTFQTTIVALTLMVLPLLLSQAAVFLSRQYRLHAVYAGFALFIRPPPSA